MADEQPQFIDMTPDYENLYKQFAIELDSKISALVRRGDEDDLHIVRSILNPLAIMAGSITNMDVLASFQGTLAEAQSRVAAAHDKLIFSDGDK